MQLHEIEKLKSDPRLSRELDTLDRLLKIGIIGNEEYSFARGVLEKQAGVV